MFKLLVILYVIKLPAQINIFIFSFTCFLSHFVYYCFYLLLCCLCTFFIRFVSVFEKDSGRRFFCEFCEVSKNTFSTEHLQWLLLCIVNFEKFMLAAKYKLCIRHQALINMWIFNENRSFHQKVIFPYKMF